jgi:hypothetical protein
MRPAFQTLRYVRRNHPFPTSTCLKQRLPFFRVDLVFHTFHDTKLKIHRYWLKITHSSNKGFPFSTFSFVSWK